MGRVNRSFVDQVPIMFHCTWINQASKQASVKQTSWIYNGWGRFHSRIKQALNKSSAGIKVPDAYALSSGAGAASCREIMDRFQDHLGWKSQRERGESCRRRPTAAAAPTSRRCLSYPKYIYVRAYACTLLPWTEARRQHPANDSRVTSRVLVTGR